MNISSNEHGQGEGIKTALIFEISKLDHENNRHLHIERHVKAIGNFSRQDI